MSSPRRDIAEAEARMRVTFGTRTAIKNLHEIIEDDETVQELVACLYSGGDGLLVLTDRRILGVRDDYSKYHVRDHALSGAQKLDYDPVVHDGFAITTSTGRLVVRKMHVEDSGRLVARLQDLLPDLVIEVTRPTSGGRVPVRSGRAGQTPQESTHADEVTRQAEAAGAAAEQVTTGDPVADGAAETAPAPNTDADKGVLMGVLADLHAKGLLTDAELAAKLAQVAAKR